MFIDEKEAKIILSAFSWKEDESEFGIKKEECTLITRFLVNFPQLLDRYDGLAGYCGCYDLIKEIRDMRMGTR